MKNMKKKYENFENELMRDQFIAGLVSKQIRVELIGKGYRHEDEERQKVSLRESKWLRLQKQYEATTITNKLMKDARGNQNQSEQINYYKQSGKTVNEPRSWASALRNCATSNGDIMLLIWKLSQTAKTPILSSYA